MKMKIRSNKIAELLCGLVKQDDARIEEYKKAISQPSDTQAKVELHIDSTFRKSIELMFVRHFDVKEIATMLLNENNPKTMDYFFLKLLDVRLDNAHIAWSGALSGQLRSANTRITEAFSVLNRVNPKNYAKGQLYFTLDIHEEQIFPKSRSFRICSKRMLPVSVPNPRKGQVKNITYGSGYTASYPETPTIEVAKHITLYCRNSWERKGEVKPSRAKKQEEEVVTPSEHVATAEVVSVI